MSYDARHNRNSSVLGGRGLGEAEREVKDFRTEPHLCCYLVIQQTCMEPLLCAGHCISWYDDGTVATTVNEVGSRLGSLSNSQFSRGNKQMDKWR